MKYMWLFSAAVNLIALIMTAMSDADLIGLCAHLLAIMYSMSEWRHCLRDEIDELRKQMEVVL